MTPEQRQEREDNDLRALMKLAEGRRFLWALMEFSVASSFAGEETHRTAFNEGRRSVGAELMAECQRVAPQDWLHMLDETFKEREGERLEAEQKAKEKDDGD